MDRLFGHPLMTVATLRERPGFKPAGASHLPGRLARTGLLRQVAGFARNRRFRFDPDLRLLEEPPEEGATRR